MLAAITTQSSAPVSTEIVLRRLWKTEPIHAKILT